MCVFGCGKEGAAHASNDGADSGGPCVTESTLSLDESKAFFPFRPGNRWNYRGQLQLPGGTTVDYASSLAGLDVADHNGVSTQPLRTTNPRNSLKSATQFFTINDTGIENTGNDDTTDLITPELVPYSEAKFPIQICSTFQQYDATVDSGHDLDADGKNDPMRLVSEVWMRALEDVDTPIGTFTDALRVEYKTTATITGTKTGMSGSTEETSVEWYAPGVGPVKRTVTNEQETIEEALYGFGVDATGRGADVLDPLATGIADAGSDQDSPGRPAVASDGNGFLVIYVDDSGLSPALQGLLLSKAGAVEKSFSLDESGRAPSAAYDGQSYFVAFESSTGIDAVRLGPDGTKLGTAIPVAANTTSNVIEPDVAFGGDAFLVAYSRYNGTEWDLAATRVSTAGSVLGDTAVSNAPRNQGAPAVAFDGTNFLVAWSDARNDTDIGENTDIYAARIATDGTVIDATGIAVATSTAPESDVDVTYDGSRFVLAWYTSRNASFIGDGDIHAGRLGSDGALLDGDAPTGGIAINTTDRSKGHPRVARFGTGALVVWDSQDFDTNSAGILGARLDQNGALLDGAPTDEGVWLSALPSTSVSERFVLPALAAIDDRILLAYVDNVETSGKTKSLAASVVYPW